MSTASKHTQPAESSAEQRRRAAVKRLPAPQPGVEIKVPLALWPLYMELHKVEPKQYRNHVLIIKRQEPAHE